MYIEFTLMKQTPKRKRMYTQSPCLLLNTCLTVLLLKGTIISKLKPPSWFDITILTYLMGFFIMMHCIAPCCEEQCFASQKCKQRLPTEQFYPPLRRTYVSEMLIVLIAGQKFASKHSLKCLLVSEGQSIFSMSLTRIMITPAFPLK